MATSPTRISTVSYLSMVYAVTVSSIDLSLEESRVMLEDVNILGHYFIIQLFWM